MFCTLDATIIPIIFNHYQITLVTVQIQRVVPEYVHAPPLPLFLIFVVRYIKLTLVFVPYDFHIIYNPTRFFMRAPPPPLRNSNASKLNGSLAVFYFTFFIALLMITCQINIHSPLYAHNMEAGILLSMR